MNEKEIQTCEGYGMPTVLFMGTPFVLELVSGTRYEGTKCEVVDCRLLKLFECTEILNGEKTEHAEVSVLLAHITMVRANG